MYRTLDTQFWTDPTVKLMSTDAKLLFLYFITNPHTHVGGIYYLPMPMIAIETGIDSAKIDTLCHTLSIEYPVIRIDYAKGIVWVSNMLRHQKPGEKVLRGVANHLETLHDTELIVPFLDKYPEIKQYGNADTLYHRVSERKSKHSTLNDTLSQTAARRKNKEQDQTRTYGAPHEKTSLPFNSVGVWIDLLQKRRRGFVKSPKHLKFLCELARNFAESYSHVPEQIFKATCIKFLDSEDQDATRNKHSLDYFYGHYNDFLTFQPIAEWSKDGNTVMTAGYTQAGKWVDKTPENGNGSSHTTKTNDLFAADDGKAAGASSAAQRGH